MDTGAANPDRSDERASAEEVVVDGGGAAPGIAVGTAYRYDASAPEVRRDVVEPEAVDAELELLENALQRARQELETVRALVPDALDADTDAIIEGQALMLRDDELRQALRQHIRETHESAGRAVKSVLKARRQRLEASDDEYMRERADDLDDLEKRLLRALRRGTVASNMETHSVLVAQTLTATDLLRFSRHSLLGCVTAGGGATSHVAVIAKALNLPLVAGAPEAVKAVSSGDAVIVDGDEGRVLVHPRESTLEQYRARHEERDPVLETGDGLDWPVRTANGQVVRVRANVGVEAELDLLDAHGADGIGLFRTELFFLADGGGTLAEDHQAEVYRQVAEAGESAGATIRLLDLGGDERIPRIHAGPPEANPYLGWRGIRALLDRPDELLRPQLRALLRANRHGALRVLLPMVADLDEVKRVQRLLSEEADRLARNDVAHDPDLPLGIMVEVPAAALQVHAFAEHVDFFSIGTNDLTQYVLAADRGNDRVAGRHDALHPAVLGLIVRVVEAGRMAGCSVEICGEIAADVQAVPVLLGLGVDTLSVSPQHLPDVQRIIRAVRLADAKGLAREALDATDAETVRRRAREWVDTHMSSSSTHTPEDDTSGD
ncbi:MAG: phosphoenolpyruvate--protein phosphotransferase [Bacteroidetes bacterium QH_2_64_26]|nr:MAG: phosphoenolpyruvate--protein phosphotransferase [Bacteroidetes bacterium QH_2_64_26]